MIEADKVKSNRLQDILFTGTGKKGDNYKFGPVVANSIKIWKTVERRIGGPFKFCNSIPLWHNFNFVCGNRPFVQPSLSYLGVNMCGDIQCPPLILAPLVNMSKGSCENKSALFILLIFYSKNHKIPTYH